MTLTAIQQSVADVLRPHRSEFSYVAGGAALQGRGDYGVASPAGFRSPNFADVFYAAASASGAGLSRLKKAGRAIR